MNYSTALAVFKRHLTLTSRVFLTHPSADGYVALEDAALSYQWVFLDPTAPAELAGVPDDADPRVLCSRIATVQRAAIAEADSHAVAAALKRPRKDAKRRGPDGGGTGA